MDVEKNVVEEMVATVAEEAVGTDGPPGDVAVAADTAAETVVAVVGVIHVDAVAL